MGNEASSPPLVEGPHREYEQRFFQEYKDKCAADPSIAAADAKRWEEAKETILDMSLEEQAAYAAHVTVEMCKIEDKEVQTPYLMSTISSMVWAIDKKQKLNTCGIGNLAQTILTCRDEVVKKDMQKLYKDVLELQRELRDNPLARFDLNAMAGSIMTDLNSASNLQDDPMAAAEGILERIAPGLVTDEVKAKVRLEQQGSEFIKQQILDGKTINEAVAAAKERFGFQEPMKLELKLTVEF